MDHVSGRGRASCRRSWARRSPTAASTWQGARRSDQHCTHQLDVATLAVAHAARVVAGGAPRRQYDIVVPFGLLDGQRHTVTLARDGDPLLAWELEGGRVVAPAP